jgi:hypothetical protein
MELIQNLLSLRSKLAEAEQITTNKKRVLEAIANTKQIESGLLDAFSDAHHMTNIHRERGSMTHRRRTLGAAVGGDIDHLTTQFMRGNAQLAIQRLLSGKVIGGVLLLSNDKEYSDSAESEDETSSPVVSKVVAGQSGQFISIGRSSDTTYKVTFNLKFIREFFKDKAAEILRDIDAKLRNHKPESQLKSNQDFITLENLVENDVYAALTKLLRELKMKDQEFAFLLVSGERKEKETDAAGMKMDSEPTEDAPEFEVEQEPKGVNEQVFASFPNPESGDCEFYGPFLTEGAVKQYALAKGWDAFDIYDAHEAPSFFFGKRVIPVAEADDEPTDTGLELKGFTGDAKAFSAKWPDGTYGGESIFKLFYGDESVQTEAESEVARIVHRHTNSQECYLGYSPRKDIFLMGFDVWTEAGNSAAVVPMKVTTGPRPVKVGTGREIGEESGKPFYDNLEELKKSYPDLINLRLD